MSIDSVSNEILENIRKELHRIEECCDYSSKGHFYLSKEWGRWHFRLGISATVLSAIVSCLASECLKCGPLVVIMTIVVTTVSAIITFLKPSEQSETRRSYGNQYLMLRNQCRRFREIEMSFLSHNLERLLEQFNMLTQKHEDLNNSAPTIPERCYKLAKQGIEAGQTTHQVDIKEK